MTGLAAKQYNGWQQSTISSTKSLCAVLFDHLDPFSQVSVGPVPRPISYPVRILPLQFSLVAFFQSLDGKGNGPGKKSNIVSVFLVVSPELGQSDVVRIENPYAQIPVT
jgi:hypothetical protein